MCVSDYFDGVYQAHERFWWRDPARHSTRPEDYPSSLLAQQTLRVLARAEVQGRALDLGAVKDPMPSGWPCSATTSTPWN